MKKRFGYKGRYSPTNPEKYKGDVNNIIFRSLWERRFMVYCDTNKSVLAWSSEELSVPYISPVDNRLHKYYPDFILQLKSPNNIEEKKITMIEIKPKRQTKPPKKTQNKRRFIYETKTWGVNEAKFKAAELYCKKKGWDFKILTEDHILAGHK